MAEPSKFQYDKELGRGMDHVQKLRGLINREDWREESLCKPFAYLICDELTRIFEALSRDFHGNDQSTIEHEGAVRKNKRAAASSSKPAKLKRIAEELEEKLKWIVVEKEGAEDEYKWKKYGQKAIIGVEYPRLYYACAHIGCPAKKQVQLADGAGNLKVNYIEVHNCMNPVLPTFSQLELNQVDSSWELCLNDQVPFN